MFKYLLGCLLLISVNAIASDLKFDTLKKPITIGEFELVDQNGDVFTRESLKGRWSLIFVGFTSCPDVCPYTLARLESLRAELGLKVMPDNLPEIVFLAVDPNRDKPVLKQYLDYFHGEFIGLTGDKNNIDKLIKGIDGFYRFDKKKSIENYQVVHSSAIAVVNPDAQTVAQLYPPFGSPEAAFELFKIMRGIKP